MKTQTPRILFLGHNWPEPDSSAAGYRTLGLIKACLQANWPVCFASAAEPGNWSHPLQKLGVQTHSIQLNHDSFDHWLAQQHFDMVIYDRFMTEEQFGWRVQRQLPDCVRILDTCDLHFLRHYRQQHIRGKTVDWFNPQTIRELSSIYRCDLSLIISSYEFRLLQQQFSIPKALLCYLGFMYDPIDYRYQKNFDQRKNFMMIGNFLHAPNSDAVDYLYHHIWPDIRQQLAAAEVHIYGAYAPAKVRQYHQPRQGFHIMGRAGSLQQIMPKYRLNLAPLRFGAGIKGKICDGFFYGLPCITTETGAEGIDENGNWNNMCVQDIKDFAPAAVRLYLSRENWRAAQQQGYLMLQRSHLGQKNQTKFITALKNLLKPHNLQQHRKNNLVGTMLNYHNHRSHEFMSRWIAAKNHPVKQKDRE